MYPGNTISSIISGKKYVVYSATNTRLFLHPSSSLQQFSNFVLVSQCIALGQKSVLDLRQTLCDFPAKNTADKYPALSDSKNRAIVNSGLRWLHTGLLN